MRSSRLASEVACGSSGGVSSADLALVPGALSSMSRAALHLALDSTVAPERSEAAFEALGAAVDAAESLFQALRSAVEAAAGVATDGRSPAPKRSKSGAAPLPPAASLAVEGLLGVLAVLGEAALLRLPGWHSPPFSKVAEQVRPRPRAHAHCSPDTLFPTCCREFVHFK